MSRSAIELDDTRDGDLGNFEDFHHSFVHVSQQPTHTNYLSGNISGQQLANTGQRSLTNALNTEEVNVSGDGNIAPSVAVRNILLQSRSAHKEDRRLTNTLQVNESIHPYDLDNGLLISDQEIVFPPYENMEVFTGFPGSTWSFPGLPIASYDMSSSGDQAWDETAQHLDITSGLAADSLEGRSNGGNSSKSVQRLPPRAAFFSINDHTRDILIRDTESRLPLEDQSKLKLPSTKLLNRFLAGYLLSFHPHYPIFHIPTMVIEKTPAPLVLAICTIGALFRLDRKHAAILQQWADHTLSHVSTVLGKQSSRCSSDTCKMTETAPETHGLPLLPISALQGKFLLAFAEIFSGRTKTFKSVFGLLDQLSMV
jgi:hypothetical protein